MLHVKKPSQEIKTKLNPDAVRCTFYSADDAADPPGHARVIVHIPGNPQSVNVDIPLSEIKDLKPEDLAAIEKISSACLSAALVKEGYVSVK